MKTLVPLLLDVKPTNMVMPLSVSEQNTLKTLPHSLCQTLVLNGVIDVLDMINSNRSCSQIVESKACFDEVCSLVHILGFQRYLKSPKTPLEFMHPPFCSLTIG